MMAWDSVDYLPQDILVKVDRAAMAVSLETRTPLLDHRIIELALPLPIERKLRPAPGPTPSSTAPSKASPRRSAPGCAGSSRPGTRHYCSAAAPGRPSCSAPP